jgi:hypothetical protein
MGPTLSAQQLTCACAQPGPLMGHPGVVASALPEPVIGAQVTRIFANDGKPSNPIPQ